MQGVKYFLILQSLLKGNQLCFVFVWLSCFHYFVLKGITRFSFEMLVEIPHLSQIPQCVQTFHVSYTLEEQNLKINSSKVSVRGFTLLQQDSYVPIWNRAGNAVKCFIGGSIMFCLNCLQIAFGFVFFFLNTFLVHLLQKPDL